MLSKSILSDTQKEILEDMTYRLGTDVLLEIERLVKKEQTCIQKMSLENMPLPILLRVALENIAEKHVIDSTHKATYHYLKKL
jgi:hypothetical protein